MVGFPLLHPKARKRGSESPVERVVVVAERYDLAPRDRGTHAPCADRSPEGRLRRNARGGGCPPSATLESDRCVRTHLPSMASEWRHLFASRCSVPRGVASTGEQRCAADNVAFVVQCSA